MKSHLRETIQSTAPEVPGVYVLTLDAKPVYVGRSRNMRRRVSEHVGATDFDGFDCQPCAVSELTRKEKETILSLRPEHNRKLCPWKHQRTMVVASFTIPESLLADAQAQADLHERGNKSAYICKLIEKDVRAAKGGRKAA